MDPVRLDRLAILTVSGSQADLLMEQLKQAGFHFTVIHTTGGMIQETQVCLLVGFHSERMGVLVDLVRKNCHPYRQYVSAQGFPPGGLANLPMVEAELGGALFCMMNVEQFEQI